MTPEQAAKEAWDKEIVYASNRTVIAIDDIPKERWKYVNSGITEILAAYQTSLKKMVEAQIEELRKEEITYAKSSAYRFKLNSKGEAYKEFLELITTAMPPSK